MTEIWYALNNLPSGGLALTVDEIGVWAEPAEEFGLDCEFVVPVRAEITLLPQTDGCIVRGHMRGEVNLPCDRCAAKAKAKIDQRIDCFEPFPDSGDSDFDDAVMRVSANGPEINIAALLWQEFSLALPVHPLCRPDCAGLCVYCGQDLNDGPCACVSEEGDPRLALLRALKVNR
jgi:uncharacterized protein